jgi:small subunit ribosomal protein S21
MARDELGPLEVEVRDNNINRALNRLKREIGREGISRELKRRRFYEKPSVAKRRKMREAERRRRKEERRRKRRKHHHQ